MTLRVLIVDDEELARERLRVLLEAEPGIKVLGECASGTAAVAAIRAEPPDLLFLDIQMPGLDGFGVLRELGADLVPAVIFVTAYEQYALQAFDHVALDYLLKPFDGERFRQALGRARDHVAGKERGALRRQIERLLQAVDRKTPERILVKDAGRIHFVKVDDIRWIEAQGNYARLHAKDGGHMVRRNMKDLAAGLDPARFLRIHRSTIVNIDCIKELSPLFHGEYEVLLHDCTRLTSNRRFKDDLERLLKGRS